MGVPAFLLRKLYRKGSLRQTADGRFAFMLQNPLADATIVAPPEVTVNGIHYPPERIKTDGPVLERVSAERPLVFAKGDTLELNLKGHLMRGGNRISLDVETKEFGRIEIFVEDREALFCDMPTGEEE